VTQRLHNPPLERTGGSIIRYGRRLSCRPLNGQCVMRQGKSVNHETSDEILALLKERPHDAELFQRAIELADRREPGLNLHAVGVRPDTRRSSTRVRRS
jgi:hypothetical protein